MERRALSTPPLNMPMRIIFAVAAIGRFAEEMPWSRHTPLQITMACAASLTFLLMALNSIHYVWMGRLFAVVAVIYATLVFYQLGLHTMT